MGYTLRQKDERHFRQRSLHMKTRELGKQMNIEEIERVYFLVYLSTEFIRKKGT